MRAFRSKRRNLFARDIDVDVGVREKNHFDLRGDASVADRHLPERLERHPIPHQMGQDRDGSDLRVVLQKAQQLFEIVARIIGAEPTMRAERILQASIFDMFARHEIGRELRAMSQWLDEHRELVGPVADDLRRRGVGETGRRGLPAESALRCGLLKQHRQLSYEELAFHLEDSSSFRAFARLPLSWTPKKSVLHKTISAIRAETWEAINRTVLASAREERLESGRMVRLDSTVTAALMHEPSDSSLLWDGVRVMARLLQAADVLIGGAGV